MKKELKAWMFLDSNGLVILDAFWHSDDIFFKKPPPRRNPFNYGSDKKTWKPTEVMLSLDK